MKENVPFERASRLNPSSKERYEDGLKRFRKAIYTTIKERLGGVTIRTKRELGLILKELGIAENPQTEERLIEYLIKNRTLMYDPLREMCFELVRNGKGEEAIRIQDYSYRECP